MPTKKIQGTIDQSPSSLESLLKGAQRMATAEHFQKAGAGVHRVQTGELHEMQESVTLPSNMPLEVARSIITQVEQQEGTVVNVSHKFRAIPEDGIHALHQVINALHGGVLLREGFFGPTAEMIDIRVGPKPGQVIQVAQGKLYLPGLQSKDPKFDGWISPQYENTASGMPQFVVRGQVLRRHEHLFTGLMQAVEKFLSNGGSIYQGQPMVLDLSHARAGYNYRIGVDAPQFLDFTERKRDDVILNPDVEAMLNGEVYLRIENPGVRDQLGIVFKSGFILEGPFGTGKTMITRAVAEAAFDQGITTITVKNVLDFGVALDIASLYSGGRGTVIFVEDLDRVAASEVDEILNQLDSIQKKGDIMVIATTNYIGAIQQRAQKALRPGRFDQLIHVGLPEGETVDRFVRHYLRDARGRFLLEDGADMTEVRKMMGGFVPAFIAQACRSAVLTTAKELNSMELVGRVKAETLAATAKYLRKQQGMAEAVQEVPSDIGAQLIQAIADSVVLALAAPSDDMQARIIQTLASQTAAESEQTRDKVQQTSGKVLERVDDARARLAQIQHAIGAKR